MKKRTEHEEIKRLTDAVDLFAQAMKLKLIECAKNGKRGWDGNAPTDYYLAQQLREDAMTLASALFGDDYQQNEDAPCVIDIANRCMMLWYRHSQDAVATDPVP